MEKLLSPQESRGLALLPPIDQRFDVDPGGRLSVPGVSRVSRLLSPDDIWQADPNRPQAPHNPEGIALPPSEVDCLGDDCWYSSDEYAGECFDTGHHLLHYRRVFEARGRKSLAYKVRNHKASIFKMAMCRHDLFHYEYRGLSIPSEEVMEEYLREADLYLKFGESIINLACNELDLDRHLFTPVSHKPKEVDRRRDRWGSSVEELRPAVARIALLSPRVLEDPIAVVFPKVKAPQEAKTLIRELLQVAA